MHCITSSERSVTKAVCHPSDWRCGSVPRTQASEAGSPWELCQQVVSHSREFCSPFRGHCGEHVRLQYLARLGRDFLLSPVPKGRLW